MAMHGVPEPGDWRARLVWKHHRLFDPPAGDPELATGLPDCGPGWEKIIDHTCSDLGAPFLFGFYMRGEIKITQVYQELGTLRFRWEEVQNKGSRTWKPLCFSSKVTIRNILQRAYAASACICEFCGAPGRPHSNGSTVTTLCTEHADGHPMLMPRGLEDTNVHIGIINGMIRVLECKQYDHGDGCFTVLAASECGLDQIEGPLFRGQKQR